jgi:hypothetical protein
MDCDEILCRAADLTGGDAAVAAHVASCAACRTALADARDALGTLAEHERTAEDALPPADADAAWAAARTPSPAAGARLLRLALRAAAVVLVSVGALALVGGRVEVSQGRVALVVAPPWAEQEPPPAPTVPVERVEAALAALRADVAGRLGDLAGQTAERDAANAGRLDELLTGLALRNDDDVRALVAELVALRREVAAVRWVQMADAEGAAPPLPDPR